MSAGSVRVVNLEAGLPTLEEARRMLAEELRRSRKGGNRVLKVIHGYGSSGKGGKLCFGLRRSLALRVKEGVIKAYIPGEEFTIFNKTTLDLLEVVAELRGDPDLGNTNEGVTIVWIR